MSFSSQKGEFDRFFNRHDRPVEESQPDRPVDPTGAGRPDRFPSLEQIRSGKKSRLYGNRGNKNLRTSESNSKLFLLHHLVCFRVNWSINYILLLIISLEQKNRRFFENSRSPTWAKKVLDRGSEGSNSHSARRRSARTSNGSASEC